jgi:hypothetical protein
VSDLGKICFHPAQGERVRKRGDSARKEVSGMGVAKKKENLQDTKQVDGFCAIILPNV